MTNASQIRTHVHNGKISKIDRYKWQALGDKGTFREIHKSELSIPREYQRDTNSAKVLDIASKWSWFGCAVIIVAYRNETLWVVDGQHRVLAAMTRSDIGALPCLIFDTTSLTEEAMAFLLINSGRKPISAIDKLRALNEAGDQDCAFVVNELSGLGIEIVKTANKAMQIKCIAACQRMAKDKPQSFIRALTVCAKLSEAENAAIQERVLSGLFFLDVYLTVNLTDDRLHQKVMNTGMKALHDAASRSAAYFASGGSKVWAQGILSVLNKGLKTRFAFKGEDQ